MDLRLLATVYGIIFIAELPDKTAFASLVLATRHRPFLVFVGAGAALTVQSVVAVTLGDLLSRLAARPVHILSGVLFLVSAVAMWRRDTGGEAARGSDSRDGWAAVATSFAVVFVAEWGDLTQIGTAALAARYHAPLTIFTGATLALWSVVAVVVFLGNWAGRALSPEVTKRVAAAVFAAVGVVLIVR
jgi:putative Ca2+/H+ antiporter (TMEM165/GDT1 family)